MSAEPTELPEIPGYRVIALVGGGSRGTVFRARELETQKLVALKVLRAPDSTNAAALLRDRFKIERLVAVQSPVLVKPREVVETTRPEGLAIVMEFVEGDSLARQLGRSVRLVPAKAVCAAAEVARALGAAFDAGLVHGALHPGKIILSGGTARLLGAGLGETLPREFETPEAPGVAPHVYAADEVLAGDPPSAASDVFSLGAILYHMLTGHPPWNPSGLGALRVARADGPLVWPRGSSELMPTPVISLVDRMTSQSPAARPAGGWMLAEALELALKAKESRGARRRARPVLEQPPPEVAPADVSDVGAGPPVAARGLLGRVRQYLTGPSAVRVIVGGATAVFLLAVALALRASPERAASSRETGARPGRSDGKPREPRSTAKAAHADGEAAPAPAEPTLEEIRAIEGLIAENPGDVAVFRERLEALGSEPGEVGVRATLLLARIRRSRGRRAEDALRRVADRAGALEAGGRYGEAAAALEQFPFDRFGDTAAAERARLEADAVRGRTADAFARVEHATETLLAKGDFAAARAEYEYLRDTVGFPAWVERAEAVIARIGRMEEEAAEAEVARRAAKAKSELAGEVENALAELPRLCRDFRYSKAERTLDAILAKPLTGADRERLAAYGKFVRREAAQFRLAGKRVREGDTPVRVSFRGMPRELIVRDVTEEGLDLSGLEGDGTLTTRLGWQRVSANFAYDFMLEVVKLTSFDERVALAVFAHHRDLATESENELAVAERLAVSRSAQKMLERARELIQRDPFKR